MLPTDTFRIVKDYTHSFGNNKKNAHTHKYCRIYECLILTMHSCHRHHTVISIHLVETETIA